MIKIFVIDCRPVFRLGLSSILKGNVEFQVTGDAANVNEALIKMESGQPDIVVMDVSSPGNDGIEAITLLQQKNPQIKVIVLTDSDKREDFFKSIKAGAKGYLMKSLEFTELTDSIRLVAGGGALVYSAMAAKLLSSSEGAGKELKNGFGNLSSREKEVLLLVAHGASNKEIAAQCCVSPTTVKAHLRRILEKLDVKNRAQAVAIALEKGYLTKAS